MAKAREDQPGFDGIADEFNPAVHKAARHYVKLRDARQKATEHEVAAKQALIDVMHEQKLRSYTHKEIDVTMILGDDSVKVKVGGAKAE